MVKMVWNLGKSFNVKAFAGSIVEYLPEADVKDLIYLLEDILVNGDEEDEE